MTVDIVFENGEPYSTYFGEDPVAVPLLKPLKFTDPLLEAVSSLNGKSDPRDLAGHLSEHFDVVVVDENGELLDLYTTID